MVYPTIQHVNTAFGKTPVNETLWSWDENSEIVFDKLKYAWSLNSCVGYFDQSKI